MILTITWNKNEWLSHFNSSTEADTRLTQFETDISDLDTWTQSEYGMEMYLVDSVSVPEIEIWLELEDQVSADISVFLKGEFGKRFLNILEKNGIQVT